MKTLNLDDYGKGSFAEDELTQLISWYQGKKGKKKVDVKRYRRKFSLTGGYGEKVPFVWVTRLQDWRRMERIFFRTGQAYSASSQAYWDYLRGLWTHCKKMAPEGSKNLRGYLLQELPAPGSKKKVSDYLLDVHHSHDHYSSSKDKDAIATTHRTRKEFKDKGDDASYYWGFLGTSEEDEANRLRRRNDSCMKRFHLAQTAFYEAVRIRLAAWWKHQAVESGDTEWSYAYSHRKVFTAVENEGRSYGWVSGMGGMGDLVWSPDIPPVTFK